MDDSNIAEQTTEVPQESVIPETNPEVSQEPVIETTPAKAPKKRATRAKDKVEIKVEEVKVVEEPIISEPITPKAKAKKAPKTSKKVVVEEAPPVEVQAKLAETFEAAQKPPFNSPIELTAEQRDELIRQWITVQSNNKKTQKQQKYRALMSQAV